MKQIPLGRGLFALVDDDAIERRNQIAAEVHGEFERSA